MNKQIEEVMGRVEALPDGQRTFYPSPISSTQFREMPFSTDDLKALVSELRAAREALKRIEYYASDCGRRECTCNQCEIVRILEKQNG